MLTNMLINSSQCEYISFIMLLHTLIILADVPVSLQNFLLFANRRFLVQINRDGSGTQAFTLSPDTTNAIAIDFDIR